MENEDMIREQMEDTRTSLTEKLETLEQHVASTVEGATSNIAETVEAVKETVEKVKDTVEGTVTTVKESVADTIDTVKETVHEGITAVKGMFDIPALVDAHPWLMFGGAVGCGYVIGTLFKPLARQRPRYWKAQAQPALPDHYSGEDQGAFTAPAPSRLAGLYHTFEPEINRLKGLAVGALMRSIGELVTSMVPEHLAPQMGEVLDSMTQKLGGETIHTGNGAGRSHRPERTSL
jgi:hypothetical protein